MFERWLNPFWGIYFEADNGAGGGGDAGDDPPENNDADPGGNDGGGDGEGTFTQADVDRIVGERAKRAGKSAVTDFLKSLGFEKSDDLKKIVSAQRDAAEKEKSDLQKAQEEAEAEARKSADLESQLRRERVDRVIEREAQSLGFADVTDATALIDRSEIEIDEDDQVTGVKEALEALLEAKPHLKRASNSDDDDDDTNNDPPDPKGNVPPSPKGDKKPKKLTDDEKRKKATSVGQYW